jgi:tetratricopeptide (TPR) repeat protein
MILKRFSALIAILATALTFALNPQDTKAQATSAAEIVLVLPFENTSDHPEFNWVGESFADSLASLLDKPGLIVVSSDERAVAYQRLRLPLTVIPSRATAIKLARELRASMIVFGTYKIDLAQASADKLKPAEVPAAMIMGQAKVIRVNEGRLAGENFEGGWAPRQYDFADSIKELQRIHGELAYQILFQRDKALAFSRNNLIQEATKIPPQAFEAYMKGSMTAERDSTRAIYFKNAMKLYGKDNGGAVYPAAAFELGLFYLNQGPSQWKEAIEYFTMLQKKEPHYNEAQFYAGLGYWKTGDLTHALATLVPLADEKVMPLVGVYNNAGAVSIEAARNEKKPEERTRLLTQGITLLSRAADSSPEDSTVLFNLAYGLFLNEKYGEAATKLEKVIASNQRDGEAYFLLAKSQTRASQTEAATAAENLAIKNLPSYAKWQTEWQKSQSITNLNARSRDVLNQVDVSDLSRARTLEAANANAAQQALEKIRDLYQQGHDDEALNEIRKLLNVEQTTAEAYLYSGRINQRRGDQEAAIAALKTAIFWDQDQKLIDARILLGRIFLEKGDLSEARKYATMAIAIDPDNQEAIALQRQVTMGGKP